MELEYATINIKIKTLNNDIHQITIPKNSIITDLKKLIEEVNLFSI